MFSIQGFEIWRPRYASVLSYFGFTFDKSPLIWCRFLKSFPCYQLFYTSAVLTLHNLRVFYVFLNLFSDSVSNTCFCCWMTSELIQLHGDYCTKPVVSQNSTLLMFSAWNYVVQCLNFVYIYIYISLMYFSPHCTCRLLRKLSMTFFVWVVLL